jgi:hemin uptake protein HemP
MTCEVRCPLVPGNENSYHLSVGNEPTDREPDSARATDGRGRQVDPPRRTTSRALLGAAKELVIEHDGREYRLRLTQQGKLILTA